MEKILRGIVEKGELIHIRPCYWNVRVVKTLGGELVCPDRDSEEVNFFQEGWPGGTGSDENFDTANKMYQQSVDGGLCREPPLLQLFRAIDCRLTELLYYTGMYPESCWLPSSEMTLPFWRKWRIAKHVIPEGSMLPKHMQQLQNIRNCIEHQFASVDPEQADLCFEIGTHFMDSTKLMTFYLSQNSCAEYLVESEKWLIQFNRKSGELLAFTRPYKSMSVYRSSMVEDAQTRKMPEPSLLRRCILTLLTDLTSLEVGGHKRLQEIIDAGPPGRGLGPFRPTIEEI